ncbi:MAG: threonylcarbamoyl-AMP synthase [Deferribacterales bacterium]
MKNSKIIVLTEETFEDAISETCQILSSGGLAVIPTETVYGIAASINRPNAIRDIFKAKGRPSDNPLIVHISKLDQLNDLVKEVNETSKILIKKFWPGPMTLIFKAKENLDKNITAGLDTVAIRMPDNHFILGVIDRIGPIAAPSANISGKPSGTTINDIIYELKGKVDLFIDAGEVQHGLESTVINTLSGKPVILRKGSIDKETIEKEIGEVLIGSDGSEVRSPGTKYKHYAPDKETIYIKEINNTNEFYDFLENCSKDKKIGFIYFGKIIKLSQNDIISINLTDNSKIAAKKLFRSLRELDKKADIILIMPLPNTSGLWSSIEDRIIRGSDKIINF